MEATMRVRYSYLPEQFAETDEIFAQLLAHLKTCRFTLGPEVERFEKSFAGLIGVRHAIGVGSGTDALKLALKAAGVGHGDEVITAANTFIATAGAIAELGARPVFVDVTPYYTMDPAGLERALSPRTRAIVPVHLTGEPADLGPVMDLAARKGLKVVEDACQAILARDSKGAAGTVGIAAGFSLHPLKNLNVWGDAGVVVTNDDDVARSVRLLRNHGLGSRDEVEVLGHNSRLDSIQAIVGSWLLPKVKWITDARIANAAKYDRAFQALEGRVFLAPRRPNVKRVFHLYMIEVDEAKRDALVEHLRGRGVEAKVHYPIPLFLQKGLRHLGYKAGDFPVTERQARRVVSLPVDQHLTEEQIAYVIDAVRSFFGAKG